MAINFVAAGTKLDDGHPAVTFSSLVVPRPAGVQVGDLLLMGVACGRNSAHSFSTPATWTLLSQANYATGGFNSAVGLFWKIAESADISGGSVSVPVTNSPAYVVGIMVAYRNTGSGSIAIDLAGDSFQDDSGADTTFDWAAATHTLKLAGATEILASALTWQSLQGQYGAATAPTGFTKRGEANPSGSNAEVGFKFFDKASAPASMSSGASGNVQDGGAGSVIDHTWHFAIGIPVVAPAVTTDAASDISGAHVTMNGSVDTDGNADTTWHFEYGLTTGYGNSTAGGLVADGDAPEDVLERIGGLDFDTLYHYRLVGVNSAGTTNGTDQTFTTGERPPLVYACENGMVA